MIDVYGALTVNRAYGDMLRPKWLMALMWICSKSLYSYWNLTIREKHRGKVTDYITGRYTKTGLVFGFLKTKSWLPENNHSTRIKHMTKYKSLHETQKPLMHLMPESYLEYLEYLEGLILSFTLVTKYHTTNP